jgi:hypothetical protein
MSAPNRGSVWLVRGWWLVMPPFAALVARLAFERSCAAPYELLPTLTRLPQAAWGLAALYVAAHAWLAAAYLVTIQETGALVPGLAAVRTARRGRLPLLLVACAIFAIEYAPISMWQAIGRTLSCGQ